MSRFVATNRTRTSGYTAGLSGADLEGARLRHVDFEGAILVNADFKRTDLRQATFENANLKGAEFRGSDMRGTDVSKSLGLEESKLAQSCLDETTILPAGFALVTKPTEACSGLDDD